MRIGDLWAISFLPDHSDLMTLSVRLNDKVTKDEDIM